MDAIKKKSSGDHHHHHHSDEHKHDHKECKGHDDLCEFDGPLEAFKKGKREKILYVSCVNPQKNKPDYLAVVDADEKSSTFCQVIHRVYMPNVGDELHHYGWNHCTGCRHHEKKMQRTHLLMPALYSGNVYVINVAQNEKKPVFEKTIQLQSDAKITFPHTVHCTPDGKVLISCMGDQNYEAAGNFAILDGDTFAYEKKWSKKDTAFGYDFWYKPRLNVLISSSWGPPSLIKSGFKAEDAAKYGKYVYIHDWKTHELIQTIDLGLDDGTMVLEVRMTHDPVSPHCYVITGLGSSMFHIWKDSDSNTWKSERVDKGEPVKVDENTTPAIFTDSVISMDDKFMYVSAWLQGYIRQYDITNKWKPKIVSQIAIGGSTPSNKNLAGDDKEPKANINGGSQMLQLSLDGKRLYVTDSLYSVWDKEFYPNLITKGAHLLRINVDQVNGGMTLDESFSIDFGNEPDGPVLAHEIRYPGGDCTSDIFV